MFLIHQAFKPPVSCLILQSSSTRSSNVLLRILQYPSIRGIEISRSYRATPLAKNRHKGPETGCTSRLGLPCGRPFSATPIAICASECQKHIVKCTVSIFWLILSLLASIFKPSCSKMASRWPNIAPSCSKSARLDPPVLKKPMKTECFSMFFNI